MHIPNDDTHDGDPFDLAAMVRAVRDLCEVESPTADLDACLRCADLLAGLGTAWLGAAPERIVVDDRPHLRWGEGGPGSVVIVGHFDTVWPMGTLARWPFSVDGDVATAPGIFDMKAGLVIGLAAAASVASDRVCVLYTSDEEVGSPTSRALIEQTAAGAAAALVLEPAHGPAVKTARKGVSLYRLTVTGRAAHAGLEPEKGANALVELARQVPVVAALARPELGTTVTPTVAHAGTTTNTVPAVATLDVDVRATDPVEQQRVDDAIRGLDVSVPGTRLDVSGQINRAPLTESASLALYGVAREVAATLGMGELAHVAVGGASDGNFTAGLGVPTLDGLGAVGDGSHSEGEHVLVPSLPERARLVAGIARAVMAGAPARSRPPA